MKTPAEILANKQQLTSSNGNVRSSVREQNKSDMLKTLQSSTESFSSADLALLTEFWARMGDIYAAKWTGSYGASPTENGEIVAAGRQWFRQLEKLNDAQLRMAFKRIANKIKLEQHANKDSWPPAPLEFYAMAVDTTAVDWEHKRQSQPYFVDDVARPALPDNSVKKTPAEHIAEMKSLLGMK